MNHPRLMNRVLVVSMLVLAVATAGTAFLSGRFGVFFLIPPWFLPGIIFLLCFLAVTLLALWSLSIQRLLLAAIAFFIVFTPVLFLDDGYFEMGRRAHIRSVFSQELMDEIVDVVRKKIATGKGFRTLRDDDHPHQVGELKSNDLPRQVGGFGWGFPGYASFSHDPATKDISVSLAWGGSLISRHGLEISSVPIPFHGYPTYGGDDPTVPYYSQKFYPWLKNGYIMIDEN
jgi:hypothetical protein